MKEFDTSKYKDMYIIGIMATFILFVLSTPLIESNDLLFQLIGKIIMLLIAFFIGLFVFRYPDAGYKVYMDLYAERAKPFYEWSDNAARSFKSGGIIFMFVPGILIIILILEYLFT